MFPLCGGVTVIEAAFALLVRDVVQYIHLYISYDILKILICMKVSDLTEYVFYAQPPFPP